MGVPGHARETEAPLFVLSPNQVHRFYQGGAQIARFRALEVAGDGPEDWVASTTTVADEPQAGLTRLPDGRLLADAIDQDPTWFLGPGHVAAYGTDSGLLVKLLDAGERLPVHCHPDRAYSRANLGCVHGKTEAWIVLAAGGADPCVYLGFAAPVPAGVLAGWVARQDAAALLGSLHKLPVVPGDSILVPAGTPHAIGPGVFVAELQEPTDLSILLEWRGFVDDGAQAGTLGLGFDRALGAVDRTPWDAGRLAAVRRGAQPGGGAQPDGGGVTRLLPPAADSFFRADRLRPDRGLSLQLDAGYAVWVVASGRGVLHTVRGGSLELSPGMTVLVAYGDGPARLTGPVEVIRCQPPAPG